MAPRSLQLNSGYMVAKVLVITFRHWRYVLLALLVAALLLFIAIWLPNLSFMWYLFTDSAFSWATRFSFIGSSLTFLQLNSTPASRAVLFTLIVLAGMNVSLLTYYLRRRLALGREMGLSLFGTILGLVGVGCASCGSVVLSSIFGLGATAGFLALLPLRGLEFGLISIFLLAVSVTLVSRKIIDKETAKENMDIDWKFKLGQPVKIRIFNDPRQCTQRNKLWHLDGPLPHRRASRERDDEISGGLGVNQVVDKQP